MIKIKPLAEQKIDPGQVKALTLAYVGDASYELYIRRHLVLGGLAKPQSLQRHATYYVSAKAQAGLITLMQEQQLLTDDELEIFRRGRNAHSHTHAKNTKVATYKLSTGFEAVIGYLELKNDQARVNKLCAWCVQQIEEGKLAKYDFE